MINIALPPNGVHVFAARSNREVTIKRDVCVYTAQCALVVRQIIILMSLSLGKIVNVNSHPQHTPQDNSLKFGRCQDTIISVLDKM